MPNPDRIPSQNCACSALGAAGRPLFIAATSIIRRCDDYLNPPPQNFRDHETSASAVGSACPERDEGQSGGRLDRIASQLAAGIAQRLAQRAAVAQAAVQPE